MQRLDIDQLIQMALHDPSGFEEHRAKLIQDAIQSCEKPAIARQLQAAVVRLQHDPAGSGRDTLKTTLATINDNLTRLIMTKAPDTWKTKENRQGNAPGTMAQNQERKTHD